MTRRTSALMVVAALQIGGAILGARLAQAPPADPAAASPLPDCDRLKAENLKLRAQVLELQRGLAQAQLDRETARLDADRQTLEATFRALLKPKAGEVFDWSALVFKPPTPAQPPAPQP